MKTNAIYIHNPFAGKNLETLFSVTEYKFQDSPKSLKKILDIERIIYITYLMFEECVGFLVIFIHEL